MVAALEVLKLRNNDPRLNQTFRDLNLFLGGFTRMFNAGRFSEIGSIYRPIWMGHTCSLLSHATGLIIGHNVNSH